MLEKSISEMKFVRTREPIPTIEIDLDSIPKNFYGYASLIVQALQPIASKSPNILATFYVYQGSSINFHKNTFSAFIGVAGDKNLLAPILATFERIDGVLVRYSDYINSSSGLCEFQIQDGHVWRPDDAATWSTEVEETLLKKAFNAQSKKENDPTVEVNVKNEVEEGKEDIFDFDINAESNIENSRISSPIRFRAARADASVGAIKKKIEQIFGLPEGSVSLCGKNKTPLRSDASIATLRKRWE